MYNSGLTYFTEQMLYQVPVLLAAILGVVLSLINLKRYRLPALLALVGSAIVIITILLVTSAQSYFYSASFTNAAITNNTYVKVANGVGWLGSVARGLAVTLLIVAIFLDRKRVST